jgi:EmrB/QacA subfamily drug resistance transporter
MPAGPDQGEGIRYGEWAGRWVLLATVLGSSLVFLDATIITIALPMVGRELGAGTAGLQWTVNGYVLTLAALVLLAGSLGDRFGRRKVYVIGAVWFAVASLACGLAPTTEVLVAARILQGVGGALLTPGSLAIIHASFAPDDRARAIGQWAGLAGIATVVGPFIGGWIVENLGWRWVFLINLPISVAVVAVSLRHVPESADEGAPRPPDVAGAVLCVLGLGGLSYGLTAWSERGGSDPFVLTTLAGGLASMAGFALWQHRTSAPMLPLRLFRSRALSATQVETFLVYGALAGFGFFVTVTLQVVSGYGPLAAGVATVPITILFLLLSGRAGALGERIGPRVPMGVGPLACALGSVMLAGIGRDAPYVTAVLPGVIVLGLGLVLLVAPLTATALDSAPERLAGVASGVNNAVARSAALLAVAALPLAAGVGRDLTDAAALAPAHRTAMLICAGLFAAGGVVGLIFIPGSAAQVRESSKQRAAR